MSAFNLWLGPSIMALAMAVEAGVAPGRQQALRELLHQDCGSCHGLQLRGGLGPALRAENLAGKPRDALITTILQGRPGTAMPPWRGLVDEDEAAWLVDLLAAGADVSR